MEEKILKQILTNVKAIDNKVSDLDNKVSDLDNKVSDLDNKVNALDNKVDKMETSIRDDMKTMRQEITDEIKDRIIEERIHTEQFVRKEIKGVKTYVDELHKREIQEIGRVVDQISEIVDNNYQNHERRIVKLEKIVKTQDLRKNRKTNNVIAISKKDKKN